jgi:hypothetical protein
MIMENLTIIDRINIRTKIFNAIQQIDHLEWKIKLREGEAYVRSATSDDRIAELRELMDELFSETETVDSDNTNQKNKS